MVFLYLLASFFLSLFGFGIMLSVWSTGSAVSHVFPTPTKRRVRAALNSMAFTWFVVTGILVVLDVSLLLSVSSLWSFVILVLTSFIASAAAACATSR